MAYTTTMATSVCATATRGSVAIPRPRTSTAAVATRPARVAAPGVALGRSISIRERRTATLVQAEGSDVAPATSPLREALYPGGNDTTSPKGWMMMSEYLSSNKGFRSISPEEAEAIMDAGGKVIDVRPAKAFEEESIEGSFNAPMYQPITGWDAKKNARRAAFALFGVMNGTEENPNFFEDVEKVAGKNEKVVVLCGEGGNLEKTPSRPYGKQSRSLIAAYCLLQNGWTEVYHMNRGFYYIWGEEE